MIQSARAALTCALMLLVAAPVFASGEDTAAHLGFQAALDQARARDTVVVIDFFTDWCVYCKQFDAAKADAESGITEALGAVVFTSIDAEKGEGVVLADKYGAKVYPTYTMVNADGELIANWTGYDGAEGFIGALNTALADPLTFDEKQARFAKNPTAEGAKDLAMIAYGSARYGTAMDFLAQAARLDPEMDVTGDILDNAYLRQRKDDDYTVEEYIAKAHELVIEQDADAETTLMATYYVDRATADEADHATVMPFLVKSREVMGEEAEVSSGVATAVELKALLWLDQNPEAAIALKRTSMPEGWMEDAGKLNSFAWWCFENGVNLEEAQQLAMKGVELAEPGEERAQILDTAAELCNALGNCGEAIEMTRRAQKDAPGNKYYGEQLARFEAIQAAAGD